MIFENTKIKGLKKIKTKVFNQQEAQGCLIDGYNFSTLEKLELRRKFQKIVIIALFTSIGL